MEKDEGFILKKTKFSETSVIIQLYSLKKGLMSLYFPGAQKKNQALITPLAHIGFQYRQKNEEQLPMLTQPEEINLWKNIYFDPVKSCQLYFINEVLHHSIAQQDPDPELFSFILESMQYFNQTEKSINFHLYFLAQLTKFLGFYPEIHEPSNSFDLNNGILSPHSTKSKAIEEGRIVSFTSYFFSSSLKEMEQIELNGRQRNEIAHILIKYYQAQLEGFYPPKSLEVLATVFS